MNLANFHLAVVLGLALITCYYSFSAVNACTASTTWYVRVPNILALTGASAVLLAAIGGEAPHWSYTLLLAAFSLKVAGERRRTTSYRQRCPYPQPRKAP